MNFEAALEIFNNWLRIGRRIKTIEDLKRHLDTYEYRHFKKRNPHLASLIEEFCEDTDTEGK